MKKLAISLILGASLIITPSAFALKAMTSSNMKNATGQAGVSLALDDITIYRETGSSAYIDSDGIESNTTSTGIIIEGGSSTLITVRAVVNQTNRGGFLQSAFGGDGYKMIQEGNGIGTSTVGLRDHEIEIADLRIDIASVCPIISGMGENLPGIVVQLPTLEINQISTESKKTVAFNTFDADYKEDPTTRKNLIQISKSGSRCTTILGGKLEIAAH